MIRLLCLVVLLGQSAASYAQEVLVKSGHHADFDRLVVPLQDIQSIQTSFEDDRVIQLVFEKPAGADLTKVFDFIDRDRIRNVAQNKTGLTIELACDCAFSAHQEEGDFFYIDIIEPSQDGLMLPRKLGFEDFQWALGAWEFQKKNTEGLAFLPKAKAPDNHMPIDSGDKAICRSKSISQMVFEKGRKYRYEDLLLTRGRLVPDGVVSEAEALDILSGYIALGMSDEALALSRHHGADFQQEVQALTDIVDFGTTENHSLHDRIHCGEAYVFWAEFSRMLSVQERDSAAMQRKLETLPKVLQDILEGHKFTKHAHFGESRSGLYQHDIKPTTTTTNNEDLADESSAPIKSAPVEYLDSNIVALRNTSEAEEAKIEKISSLLHQQELLEALAVASDLDVDVNRKIQKINEVLSYVGTQVPDEAFLALVASEFWTEMDDRLVAEVDFQPIVVRSKQLDIGEFYEILQPILPKEFNQNEGARAGKNAYLAESHRPDLTVHIPKNTVPSDIRYAGLENLLSSSENLLKETENLDALNSLEAIGF